MSTPDVRVRLSAEGTADVVAALKKVQAEAETAGKKGSGGFLSMNKILGGTSALLGGLGIAVGITAIKSWIQSSLDAADAMGKMALKAGATTEHISALAMVAQTSDVEIDGLGSALARQNKFLADAASGSALAVSGLRNLRLGVTDFKGKDAVESFELISQAIMAIQDPARRVQAAMQIFGRTGADLIPTMQSLAEEGLGAVVTRATELGVLIDSKVSASAQQLNDDFKLLKLQVQGIGAHLGAGFAPQMSQSLQMMTGAVGQTTAAWQSFGVVIGAIVKGIVFAVSEAFDIVAVIVAGGAVVITALGQSIYHALTGHLKQAKQDLKTGLQGILDMRNDFADRLASRWNLLLAPPSAAAAGTRPNVANTGLDPTEQLAKRAAATARALDREVALARTKAGLRNAAEQRAFGEGLEDVHTYYDNRRRIAEQAYQDEIDAIGKRKTLLADEPDPDKRAEAAAKIDADAADLRLRHEAEIQTGIDEERNAVRELATERLGLEKNLLEAEGRRHEAALVGIEEELRKTDLLLRKQGVGEDERYAILARQRESLTAAADFDEIKRRGEQAMSDLGTARQAIQDQADAGMISQFEAEQQLLGIEKARLGPLQDLAQALEAAAQATANPDLINQAAAFGAGVEQIGVAIKAAEPSIQRFRSALIDSARTALTDFFATGIDGATTFKSAFRDMANSIAADLRRLASQMLATDILKGLGSIFHFSVGGQVQKKARGGLLDGIGGPVSDLNLAWFSPGEYLVRAAVVREPGILQHLEELNRRGTRTLISTPMLIGPARPRYALGGLVGPGAGPAPQPGGDSRMLIGLDDGLLLKALDSPRGQRILIETVGRNRRTLRRILEG